MRTKNGYAGFAIDLLHEIAKDLQFQYEIYTVHDEKFGSIQNDGTWSGLIGEILSRNATMTIAPLTMNAEREVAIDFTKPFKTRGITVLMKAPQQTPSYFQFLKPLDILVWISVLITMAVISALLYTYEKHSQILKSAPSGLQGYESAWFVWGSLVSGGTEQTPGTISGRLLSSAWWFFCLILISSYTANLTAFLTVKVIQTPIKTPADLAAQSKLLYGTVRDSDVLMFLNHSDIEPYRTMWNSIQAQKKSVIVNSTEEGVKKVKEGNYAFLWDNTVLSFLTGEDEDCQFLEIGPPFDYKGFGIGVPPGAIYRDELSISILKLQDSGKINQLENK